MFLPFKPVYPSKPWQSPEANAADRAWLGIDEQAVCYTTSGPSFPTGNNTYVPPDISGRLRVGFSRDKKKFHLPKYVQYVETPKSIAYYLKITTQEAARVINVQDFQFPDGQPDRANDDGTESFDFIPFTTQRNSYKFRLGDKAVKQADWPVVESHAAIKAAQCMTARTIRMLTTATTASTWQQATNLTGLDGSSIADNPNNLSADHTATATVIGGGLFDQGTSTNPNLKNGLGAISDLVNQDTLGVIDSDPEKFYVLMNPASARKIAASPEIHEYIKGSYWAREEIESGSSPNGKYGLPSSVYGYKVIVENCVVTTSRKGANLTRGYAFPNQTLLVCSRVGELEGTYGAPSFSTLTMFWYQDEMTVEAKHDDWDRLTYGRVIEDTFEAVTCTASGYLVTAATS